MRSIAKNSIPLVERVLSNSNIYSVTKLPLSAAIRDCGAQSIKLLQSKWLYDKDGLYHTLTRYSTLFLRLAEFATYGDYINSLRQRVSIVHEIILTLLHTLVKPEFKQAYLVIRNLRMQYFMFLRYTK